jgi:hypothetical protein
VATAGRPHPTLNAMLLCDHTKLGDAEGEENLALERPGRYEFRLYADDRYIAGKSFSVVQTAVQTAAS